MNTAQQIHHMLGIATATDNNKPPQRNASYTKAGPGRRHSTKPAVKTLKQKRAGAYGRGLRNWINRNQAAMSSDIAAKKQQAMMEGRL